MFTSTQAGDRMLAALAVHPCCKVSRTITLGLNSERRGCGRATIIPDRGVNFLCSKGRDVDSEPHRASSRYRWTLVGLLWFCGFFNYADRQAIFSVLPVIEAEFKLSPSQSGLIGSAFMVV